MDKASKSAFKLTVFIVDWSKGKVISTIFNQSKLRYHYLCKGRGTASSEVLDILGIGATDKAVILGLEQEAMVPRLMDEVGTKLGLNHPGTGIGFAVPLSAINGPAIAALSGASAGENNETNSEGEPEAKLWAEPEAELHRKEGANMDKRFDLVFAILNPGYSDEFMTAAREAGAGGGTVINARGLLKTGPAKLFGISIQEEKEIILILSTREQKGAIMEAVSRTHGLASKAQGLIFSVPASNITGIDLK
jgi:hypothetical protein